MWIVDFLLGAAPYEYQPTYIVHCRLETNEAERELQNMHVGKGEPDKTILRSQCPAGNLGQLPATVIPSSIVDKPNRWWIQTVLGIPRCYRENSPVATRSELELHLHHTFRTRSLLCGPQETPWMLSDFAAGLRAR